MNRFVCKHCDQRVDRKDPEWDYLEKFGACPRCKSAAPGFEPQEAIPPVPGVRLSPVDTRSVEWEWADVRALADAHRRLMRCLIAYVLMFPIFGLLLFGVVGVLTGDGLFFVFVFAFAAIVLGLSLAMVRFAWQICELTGHSKAFPVLMVVLQGLIALVIALWLGFEAMVAVERQTGTRVGWLGRTLPEQRPA